jgi:hypothetical protein
VAVQKIQIYSNVFMILKCAVSILAHGNFHHLEKDITAQESSTVSILAHGLISASKDAGGTFSGEMLAVLRRQ